MNIEFNQNTRISLSEEQEDLFRKASEEMLKGFGDWLSFFEPKFYSLGYSMAYLKLLQEPGLKKSELALFMEVNCKVSRSTAERMIKDSEEAGHIVVKDPDDRPGLALFLSDGLYNHCVRYISRESRKAEKNVSYIEGLVLEDDQLIEK